jgi:hypothetical protein
MSMVALGTRTGSRPAPAAIAVVAAALTANLVACSGPSIAHPRPSPPTAGAAYTPPPPARRYIFGQITAQRGSVWTVQGIRGNTYTVTITPMTSFGTLFHSVPREQFKVGEAVRVAGNFAGTAVTATAVNFTRHVTSAAPAH